MRGIDEGGPLDLLASDGHMQRLAALLDSTRQARHAWHGSGGALAALRAVAKHQDPALTQSVLGAAADWLPHLGGTECAAALALAGSLLTQEDAPLALPAVMALLRVARTLRPGGDNATPAVVTAVTREVASISSRLDVLLVPRGGAEQRRPRLATFDEQFAFGQALAQAREAAREAWRELEPFADGAVRAEVAGGRAVDAPSNGRRAW